MRTLCLFAVLLAFTGLCCAGRRGHNGGWKQDCDENGNPLNSDGTAENQYWDDDEMPDCEDIDCHEKPYEDLESGEYDKDDEAQMEEMAQMKKAHEKCCRHRHHKRVMLAVGVTGAVLVVALAVVVACCVHRRKKIARQARHSRFDPTTLVGGKQPVFMSPTDKKEPLPTAPVEAPMYMTSETKPPLPDGDVSRTDGVYETIQETPVKPDYVMNPPPYSEKA